MTKSNGPSEPKEREGGGRGEKWQKDAGEVIRNRSSSVEAEYKVYMRQREKRYIAPREKQAISAEKCGYRHPLASMCVAQAAALDWHDTTKTCHIIRLHDRQHSPACNFRGPYSWDYCWLCFATSLQKMHRC